MIDHPPSQFASVVYVMVTEESFLASIFSDAKAYQTMDQAIIEEIHLSRKDDATIPISETPG